LTRASTMALGVSCVSDGSPKGGDAIERRRRAATTARAAPSAATPSNILLGKMKEFCAEHSAQRRGRSNGVEHPWRRKRRRRRPPRRKPQRRGGAKHSLRHKSNSKRRRLITGGAFR